jgi:alkanesulfonate monooxygenase SsuD/methylene tetrahydromethanopterin reductase-like flavin-dependent oxidoreductase (luciferase family)
MLAQAMLADRLGYRSVSVTERHLLELGLMPWPPMAAVKIAAHTREVEILTAVAVCCRCATCGCSQVRS